MNLKRALLALTITGGTAASLFGGSLVHTALTSDAPLSYGANGAVVNGTAGTGPFAISNMEPGKSQGGIVLGLNNTGTVDEAAYITFDGLTVTHGNPNLSDFVFQDEVNGVPTFVNIPLNGTPVLIDADIPAGKSAAQWLSVGLKQDAGNSWNGATGIVHYTVHFQDVSGTDANHFVATANN